MGRGFKLTFLEERCAYSQEVHGKMVNITNHHKNINQNQNEISPHSSITGYYQKDKSLEVLVRM